MQADPTPPASLNHDSRSSRLLAYLATFKPGPVYVGTKERWRALIGAGFGILVTGLISRWWAGPLLAEPWLVAPLGASAVLVFAVPTSPLAQPWAVIGGNTLSALVGTLCALFIPDPAWAGASAVAIAIALMLALRCLHPPGGATALLTALGASGFGFAVFPMLFNSVLLTLAGVAYNGLTGRRYPPAPSRQPAVTAYDRFSTADLDAALAHYNQVLDVSRDDLEQLLHYAEASAYHRNFGDLRCSDIMSRDPLTVQFGTSLREAWQMMRARRIKALPVIDRGGFIVGIVTVADFMRTADIDRHEGVGQRLRALIRRSGLTHSEKPEVVGQIMTREVRVAAASRPAMELVPLFSEGGHHHIPIIDAERRVVGIITESDVVRALHRAVQFGRPEPSNA